MIQFSDWKYATLLKGLTLLFAWCGIAFEDFDCCVFVSVEIEPIKVRF